MYMYIYIVVVYVSFCKEKLLSILKPFFIYLEYRCLYSLCCKFIFIHLYINVFNPKKNLKAIQPPWIFFMFFQTQVHRIFPASQDKPPVHSSVRPDRVYSHPPSELAVFTQVFLWGGWGWSKYWWGWLRRWEWGWTEWGLM